MTRKTLLCLCSAVLVLGCTFGSTSFAQGPQPMGPMGFHGQAGGDMHGGPMGRGGHMEGGGMWWKNPELVTKLGLTADQQKKIDDIFVQSRIQLIDLKAALEKEELMMEPLLNANPVDTGKATAQIDKIAETRAGLEKANAKMLLNIRGVLTAAQWTTLQESRHDRGKGMRGGPGARSQGGPGTPGGPGGQRGQWGRGRSSGTGAPGSTQAAPPPPPPTIE